MIKIQRFHVYDLSAIVVIVGLWFFFIMTHPDLCRAKRKSGLSNCTGDLKQLGTAAALYEGDNPGSYPGPQPLGPGMVRISWDRSLAIQMGATLKIDESVERQTLNPPHPDVKILKTFSCPKDHQLRGARNLPLTPGSLIDGMADGPGICRSYTLNLGTGNLDGQDDGIAPAAAAIPKAKIESMAGTVFLIENHAYATVFGQRNIANDTTLVCTKAGKVVPADAFTNPLVLMHGVQSKPLVNSLMFDGHAEVLEQAAVVADDGLLMQYKK